MCWLSTVCFVFQNGWCVRRGGYGPHHSLLPTQDPWHVHRVHYGGFHVRTAAASYMFSCALFSHTVFQLDIIHAFITVLFYLQVFCNRHGRVCINAWRLRIRRGHGYTNHWRSTHHVQGTHYVCHQVLVLHPPIWNLQQWRHYRCFACKLSTY